MCFSSEDDVEDVTDDDTDDVSDDDDDDKDAPRHEECHTMSIKHTGPNGHRPVDLQPPEKLLKKVEKKVVRYIERKKVTSSS